MAVHMYSVPSAVTDPARRKNALLNQSAEIRWSEWTCFAVACHGAGGPIPSLTGDGNEGRC